MGEAQTLTFWIETHRLHQKQLTDELSWSEFKASTELERQTEDCVVFFKTMGRWEAGDPIDPSRAFELQNFKRQQDTAKVVSYFYQCKAT